jgi:hypothetical protein|tara:strand:+ start:3525 stop:3734 length:210 start_codon:yes stop_codon:yes gene_type:complete
MSKVHKLLVKFEKAETGLHNEIAELPEFGEECVCEERDTFNFIHGRGSWQHDDGWGIQTYCLNCGGWSE